MKKCIAFALALLLALSWSAYAYNYDFLLVMDTSGSMDGTPIYVLREAAGRLIDDVADQSTDSNIALEEFNSSARVLQRFIPAGAGRYSLLTTVGRLNAGGATEIDAALSLAKSTVERQLSAYSNRKICVIVMSDGYPTCDVDSAYNQADRLKYVDGVDVYTVGFFHNLDDSTRLDCEDVLRTIASDKTKYFVVDNVNDFGLIFADISEIILESGKIIIWLEGDADISIDYGGEVLNSGNNRTSFGTMQTEGRSNERKVLRLDPANIYDVDIFGNGSGYVNYTVKYPDANGEHTDTRKIVGMPVSAGLHATTSTRQTNATTIKAGGESYTAAPGERRVYHETSLPISAYMGNLAVTASSYYEKNNPPVYPSRVIDGKDSTSWDAWGEHENAWIKLTATDGYDYLISGFYIVNGKGVNKKSMEYWYKNSRVKDFSVYVDDQYIGSYTLKDDRTPQRIDFPQAVVGSSVRIQIDTVYKGKSYYEKNYGVCIAEIELW